MNHTLLVVDDSKLARLAVTRILAGLSPDWAVIEATDADDALVKTEALRPDAAVIDFNMPGRDGLSLAGELRALHPDMPLAIISANFQDSIVTGARRHRAAFLPKPLQPAAFEAFVGKAERLLDGPIA